MTDSSTTPTTTTSSSSSSSSSEDTTSSTTSTTPSTTTTAPTTQTYVTTPKPIYTTTSTTFPTTVYTETYITTPKPASTTPVYNPPTLATTPTGLLPSKRVLDDDEDEEDEDDEGDDVIVFGDGGEDDEDFKYNCNQVRNKINALLRSGEIKITEFQKMLGINSNSFQRFMKLKGPAGGIDNQTYRKAGMYFYKREKEGKKIKRRKTDDSKIEAAVAASTSVSLVGEADETVPIFDTCDEIRRKIGGYLRESGSTQAAFLRSIGALFNPPVNVQTNQLNEFMKKKGPLEGAASRVYYGAYVFFEKQRIAEGKAKSKTREEMEAQWGTAGVPRERGGGRVWVADSDVPTIDKYGKVHVTSK